MQATNQLALYHVMPHRSQLRVKGIDRGSLLEDRGTVEVGEARQVYGLLRREIAVNHFADDAGDIGDDQRSAGRPCCNFELSVRSKHDGWRHGAHWPLSRSRRIRHRLSVPHRLERKVGQLVVEKEAIRHHLCTELEFDRRGHRYDLTGIIYHRKVTRAGKLARALRRIG